MGQENTQAVSIEAKPARLSDHAVAIGLFALVAVAYHFFCWKGIRPYPFLGSDAANIAAMVAASDHPQQLAGDPVFGNPASYGFYTSVVLPYLRWAAGLTGDYGVAFMQLIGPMTFLQGLGFYLLGHRLYRNRFWAVVLALATMPRVPISPFGEF